MSAKTLGDELHEENAQAAWRREIDRRNAATLTELDYALNCAAVEIDTTNARAELAQLLKQVAWLTTDIGESGLAAINRLLAACERGDIPQHAAPDLGIARDEIVRQAQQLAEARRIFEDAVTLFALWSRVDSWLETYPAPAPQAEPQVTVIICEHCGAEIKIVSQEMWTTSEKYATCSTCGVRNSKSSIVIQMKSAPQAEPQPAQSVTAEDERMWDE